MVLDLHGTATHTKIGHFEYDRNLAVRGEGVVIENFLIFSPGLRFFYYRKTSLKEPPEFLKKDEKKLALR